jgi:nucleoside-diphosphate-sugar epimerase
LTGATGLVGQYLLRDLLRAGVKVVVVIRSQAGQSGRQRLAKILSNWEQLGSGPLGRPVCLEGDLTREGLGLNDEALNWVSENCGAVLHNAASLVYQGADRAKEPWLSNLNGTKNILELCRRTGIGEYHHVSTAYVCGQRCGLIREGELDCGQAFRTDYEHSKFEAEKLVRAANFLESPTVYRPAIIVGDSQTGYTSTYHALYSYFQFIWLFKEYIKPQADGVYHVPLRLNLTGNEERNLVPVDWVSEVISRIIQDPSLHGQTYHLGPKRRTTAREIQEVTSRYFKYTGPTFEGPQALAKDNLNTQEKMFYTYVARYQPYWVEEPRFDCTNTLAAVPDLACPPIDVECLKRLLDFAVRDNWGRGGTGSQKGKVTSKQVAEELLKEMAGVAVS